MPTRFSNDTCSHCEYPETIHHRYLHCSYVSDAWNWIQNIIYCLDPNLRINDETVLLHFYFDKGLRENAIVWLLGNFIQLVETHVMSRNQKLDIHSLQGILKERKQLTVYKSMPELGLIPGIDWNPEGIG